MKCREIEIKNNDTGEWDIIPVRAVFDLAIVGYPSLPETHYENGFYGINIGVAIPLENQEEYISFAHKYFKEKEDNNCSVFQLSFYLLGDGGEKVPVLGSDGNAYMESYGGCCIFGYINPDIIAEDDRPKSDPSTFGHLLIGCNEQEK